MGVIKLESSIKNDNYTQYVYDSFDIQDQAKTQVEINFNLSEAKNFEWSIGVIYGGSGSGKTSILKKIGEVNKSEFSYDKPLISNFEWLTPKEATLLLTSMGLSSVPTWLRPFHLLSNGEQYRASLAYKVGKASASEVILIDEYTSVVDRDVAKAMSNALQKYIRRTKKRIILASCHYDIINWIQPDWIYSPLKGRVERPSLARSSRPKIKLQISRVEPNTWDIFKKHHYLTESVNKSCKFFLFEWDNKPVGICAVINQPRKGCPNGFAISRIVVLPDFQGLGLGVKICEFCASIFKNSGGKVYIKTVNPALGEYMNNSNNWRSTSMNGKIRHKSSSKSDTSAKNRLERASYCQEYIGESLSGYENLMLPIKEMRSNNLITLF